MSELETDLKYLHAEAFEFSLEFNPHAGSHEPIGSYINDDDPEDWLSEEQRTAAFATNKFAQGRVYPNGSVSFFIVRGNDIAGIVSKCAMLCREDRERYKRAKASNPPR